MVFAPNAERWYPFVEFLDESPASKSHLLILGKPVALSLETIELSALQLKLLKPKTLSNTSYQ